MEKWLLTQLVLGKIQFNSIHFISFHFNSVQFYLCSEYCPCNLEVHSIVILAWSLFCWSYHMFTDGPKPSSGSLSITICRTSCISILSSLQFFQGIRTSTRWLHQDGSNTGSVIINRSGGKSVERLDVPSSRHQHVGPGQLCLQTEKWYEEELFK